MKKYENFVMALNNLKDIFAYEEPYSNVVLTGLVGLYEICFEQSWKAMKEVLETQGYSDAKTGSPRKILRTAYQAKKIDDEELWLDALVARNNVSHAYNQAIALNIVRETKGKYYALFVKLQQELEQNWIA